MVELPRLSKTLAKAMNEYSSMAKLHAEVACRMHAVNDGPRLAEALKHCMSLQKHLEAMSKQVIEMERTIRINQHV
jgi:hypothetical protein